MMDSGKTLGTAGGQKWGVQWDITRCVFFGRKVTIPLGVFIVSAPWGTFRTAFSIAAVSHSGSGRADGGFVVMNTPQHLVQPC